MLGLLLVLCRVALGATGLSAGDADFVGWSQRHFRDEPRASVACGYGYSGDVFREIAARVQARPGVVEVERLGSSHQGRPLWAFHVRSPGQPVQEEVLVFAGIHALEWISTEVATELLLQLLEHPPPGVGVTVVPLLNPDGRARVQRDLDAGRNLYRRGNGRGIDLNRDWAVHREAQALWKGLIPAYYETSPGALSQPETRAVEALLDRRSYGRGVSLHSFGGFLYAPWAGRFARPEDHARLLELSREMEAAQGAHAYRSRQLSRWGFFFRAQGAEVDHLYGEHGIEAFLIELSRSGMHPLRPRSWRTFFRWYNPPDPGVHRRRGVEALQALIRAP